MDVNTKTCKHTQWGNFREQSGLHKLTAEGAGGWTQMVITVVS